LPAACRSEMRPGARHRSAGTAGNGACLGRFRRIGRLGVCLCAGLDLGCLEFVSAFSHDQRVNRKFLGLAVEF
jgi:hypothetical protein